MKLFRNTFFFILLCFLPCLFFGQEVNTQGRDFWVSFMPNWPGATPKLEILVSGRNPCSGIATNPLTGWSTSFTVTPGSVTSVVIPNSEGLMEDMNKVERKAIHITTTDDVSLYASNFFDQSYDVANVLPTAILMDNYMALSYNVGATAAQTTLHSRLLIVAIENNTEIIIDPKGGLAGVFPPYSKKSITLNSGECYLCISARGDISGTTVNVKNGKKVAVFSGGDTQIPYDGCCYDAVFEQCIPMAYWGRHFVVTSSAMRSVDIVRITSLAHGCRISIDGKHRKTLGAGKFFDYKLQGDKKEAIYISASSPISVCVYLTSASWGGMMGDPSMVNINPIEQQMDKVTFASYNTAVSKYHFVNIVTQTNQVQSITLDGASIASEFKPVPKKTEMSYARVSIAHGSHTIETTNGGFVAHIYGLGHYESYAYTVGSNSKVLNQFDEDGNLILSNIPDDVDDSDNTSDGTELEEEMPPTYSHTDTLPAIEFGGLSLSELKRGGETRGIVEDPNGLIHDPDIYDITADSDYDYLLDSIDVTIESDTIILGIHPHSQWCDCFIPKRLKVEVIMVPNSDEDTNAGRIVIPISIPIEKENTWLSRCLWVLILIGALLVFVLYLLALMRKNRFKKNAMVTPVYYNYYGNKVNDQGGTKLRKNGFWAWFARWFLLGDERNTLSFDSPEASLQFVAADSNDVVDIPKGGIDSNMHINGYNPNNDPNPKEPVKLGDNGKVEITDSGNIIGYLIFSSGDHNDGHSYRLFLGILTLLSALAIVVLIVMMIRGLI